MNFHMSVAGIFAILALSACATPSGYKAPPDALIVNRDDGGFMMRRVAQVRDLEQSGRPVVIRGKCASACTMFLALPQTCVEPGARLGFHGPSHVDPRRQLRPEIRQTSVNLISKYYPPEISEWFQREGHTRVGQQFYWKTGREVIAMGARPCVPAEPGRAK